MIFFLGYFCDLSGKFFIYTMYTQRYWSGGQADKELLTTEHTEEIMFKIE
jgi:hypothetical protein